MDSCKYVVIDTPEGGMAAFVFPPFISHLDFVRNWVPYEGHTKAVTSEGFKDLVLSAGFVRMQDGKPRAYGESESLKLKADPERDSSLLQRLFPSD